jgi:hypothetical protein
MSVFWEELRIDELANDVADEYMGLLNTSGTCSFRNAKQKIRFTHELPPLTAGEPDGDDL